jgi:hypothetical protein
MTRKISIAIAFLTGLALIFLGARFLIAPQTAEAAYGLRLTDHGDYSFHYIKGIRDIMSGLLMCLFVLTGQTKALGMTLSVGTIVPVVDMLIVLSKPYNGLPQAIPHISAIIICSVLGAVLLTVKLTK